MHLAMFALHASSRNCSAVLSSLCCSTAAFGASSLCSSSFNHSPSKARPSQMSLGSLNLKPLSLSVSQTDSWSVSQTDSWSVSQTNSLHMPVFSPPRCTYLKLTRGPYLKQADSWSVSQTDLGQRCFLLQADSRGGCAAQPPERASWR